MAKLSVYHGSGVAVRAPEIRKGKFPKVFGTAFYCTTIREQAERWARRFPHPTVSIYDVRLNSSLDILEFPSMTDEWLDFIVSCRAGGQHTHDIVIGAMANDQIYNYVADFIDGSLTREQFWALARFKYPTQQIAFCTPAALRCLTFRESQEV